MKERIEALRARWSGLPARTRALVVGGVAMVAALASLGAWIASDPPMQVLFADLSSDDAGRIVEELGRLQVPYDLGEGGTTVLVPADRVHELRLTLASAGLPSGGSTGFELFDEQRFGESEFSERVKYHRALEGELQRTISHLGGVERARVHLVLPTRSVFVDDENQGTASVVLHMQPGRRVSREQAQGIVHLVASSVRGLSEENVAVVDGDGRPVAEGAGSEEVGDALAYRRRVESERERAAQELLDRTLGAGVAVVRVAADISFTREERTEERYHPDEVATRSFEVEEETRGDETRRAEGVPGAASNLPGGEAATTGATASNGGRRHETRNFEISKTIRRAVEPVGRVERLQVAVVVDGVWSGEGASRRFEARPTEELDRIREVVSHAVGVVESRGDRIAVSCVPFAEQDEVAADP
ncbi:MAG: flagellar M-ring protein FliF, partial [Sandaracinus sp.]|nr:flagellar M-ring protein FliF [Sandaracinus sp.]